MKFIFFCPEKHQTFETNGFRITDEKGVKTDASGNKIWDAKVELTVACPFCGKRHVYPASKVACPF
ncbi:MAG: hypothetical protein SWE60_09485 [Thermodesulfobacteriota bacterium]|nr:hypothetical protein [Thermodesulfobacteriota bacterium]